MSQTTVSADLLQALEILTKLAVDAVGKDLRILTVDNITLPVQEPCGNFICNDQSRLIVRQCGTYTGEGSGEW